MESDRNPRQTILVTGASGYIGAKLFQDLAGMYDVVGTYYSTKLFDGLQQLNVTTQTSVLELVSDVDPDVIIHAAANASRSACENNPESAIDTNVVGTKNIVDAANEHDARVIYLSTIGVTAADSLYARTKLSGEQHVMECNAGYDVIRASMTYGESPNTNNDRPYHRLRNALVRSGSAYFDDSWLFQPTYLDHLCSVVRYLLHAGPLEQVNDVLIPEFKTHFEIACDAFTDFDIEIHPKMDQQSRYQTELFRPTSPELPQATYEEMIGGITDAMAAIPTDSTRLT